MRINKSLITYIPTSGAGSGTVTSVALSATMPTGLTVSISGSPITSSGTLGLTLTFSAGYSIPTTAKQTEWDSAYTNRITSLTTTGSSGAATLITNVLNIPNYTLSGLGGVPTTTTITINGTSFDLSTNRTYNVGTVTSVAALTIGTSGTDISSSVANGTTTPVITLNIPTASATNRGALSSTDWLTFSSKQPAITLTTTGNSGASTLVGATINVPEYTLVGLGGMSNPFSAGIGQMIYSNGAGAPLSLAPNTTTTKKFLSMTGDGTNGDAPTWATAVTSVALTMPSAFSVTGSPITTTGTLAVSGAGLASQYIRGDGTLADFPTSGGGGSSVSYYLNGSVSQGTLGGNTYYEMSKVAILGAGTDFTIGANGYIAQFITDANDPALLKIPSGNWNFEMYFSASSNGGSPSFYVELSKYNGSTFTAIASSSSFPEFIAFGTTVSSYHTSLAVPETTLSITDRLAIRVYVVHSGRTITLHTEDNHLCEIFTTFSTGLNALNGLTTQVQYFAVGTSGSDFNISSVTDTHTFNLPSASASVRGALLSADWTTFNGKQPALSGTGFVKISGTTISYDNSTYYLASNPSAYITLTSLSAGSGISYNNTTGVITSTITQYTDALARAAISETVTGLDYNNTTGVLSTTSGYGIPTTASQTNWDTAYTNRITSLTTSGSSGAATLITNVLNIPTYTAAGLGAVPTSRTLTINDVAFDLTADRAWSVGDYGTW